MKALLLGFLDLQKPFIYLFIYFFVAVCLGLSFGDEMKMLALGSESWKRCSGRYSGAGSSLVSRAAEHPNQTAPFC